MKRVVLYFILGIQLILLVIQILYNMPIIMVPVIFLSIVIIIYNKVISDYEAITKEYKKTIEEIKEICEDEINECKNLEYGGDEIELLSSKTYEDGLKEAWEIARKIENQLGSTILVSIFGSSRIADILDNFSIQEVMEKINDYEAAKTIKVGDVVKVQSDSEYVVVATAEEMPNNMYFLRNVENNEKIYFAKEDELEITGESMYLEYIEEF